MDISSDEDERTLTMIDPCYGDDDGSQASAPEAAPAEAATEASGAVAGILQPDSDIQQEETSKSAEQNQAKILQKLQAAFQELTSPNDLEAYLALHSRMRVMVSIEKLFELSAEKCAICGEGLHLNKDVKTCGSRVEIIRQCPNNHSQKWVSSEVLGAQNNNEFFVNDYLLAAAIIISGNNYNKFALMCKALGLNIISVNTFTRFQKHCAAPVVNEIWGKMNSLVISILKEYDDLCLCGDGRNDSPGHSARYCVYTLMEHATKVVVDMAVIDKRETGGNSVTMEKEGLRRLLERMATLLPFNELTTDASSSIMKLVRDMKGTLHAVFCKMLVI